MPLVSPPAYRGRFAPSPTGPLHFGSLLAALASFMQARHCGGQWRVRIEDVDRPRAVAGADRLILTALERYGLYWDGPVVYQSQRGGAYADAVESLLAGDQAFPCACSRREASRGKPGVEGPVYPGTCRNGLPAGRRPRSIRLRVGRAYIGFHDAIHGAQYQSLARAVGDFVIRRADGLFAYQLAVVVDDAWQDITEVVRGADLLASTPRQIWLQQRLRLPTPRYAHIPVVQDRDGRKLSKAAGAAALPDGDPRPILIRALQCLGQAPEPALHRADRDDILAWALAHWRLDRIAAHPIGLDGAAAQPLDPTRL